MGFAYANEQVIQYMNNVKAPYNVNRLSQEVAVRALSDRSLYKERVASILEVCSVCRLGMGMGSATCGPIMKMCIVKRHWHHAETLMMTAHRCFSDNLNEYCSRVSRQIEINIRAFLSQCSRWLSW